MEKKIQRSQKRGGYSGKGDVQGEYLCGENELSATVTHHKNTYLARWREYSCGFQRTLISGSMICIQSETRAE
jgi:hypothetical protein